MTKDMKIKKDTRKNIICENGEIKSLSLEETINKFKYIIYNRKLLKYRNQYSEEEFEQMIYISIMKAYHYYNSSHGKCFTTYLNDNIIYQTVYTDNVYKNRLKRKGDETSVSLDCKLPNEKGNKELTLQDTLVDKKENIELITCKKEVSLLIKKCLDKLPESDRKLIDLYYFKSFNNREIGEKFGVSRQTINVRLNKAKKKLKVLLSRHKAQEYLSLY